MVIKEVILKGFKSFNETTRWRLPEQPGLYMIAGCNNVEPALGSNGSGKSTLLASIPWCLYNKTDRGLRGGDVSTWNGPKGSSVEVIYTAGDQTHSIKRGSNPGILTFDGTVVDQGVVDKTIGLNYDCWNLAVMIGQFSRYFIDLLPAEKLSLFSYVMGLDYWLECAARAKVKAAAATDAALEETNVISEVRGRYDEVADRLASLDAAISRSRRQLDADRTRLEAEVAQYNADIARIRRDVAWVQRRVHVAARAFGEATAGRTGAQAALDASQRLYTAANAKLATAKADETRLNKEVERLKKAFPMCVECGQQVSRQHFDDELANRRAKVAKATARVATCVEDERLAKEQVAQDRTAIADCDKLINTMRRSREDLTNQVRDMNHERARSENDLRHAREDLSRIDEECGGQRATEYAETLENLQNLGESLRVAQQNLRVARRREQQMLYWSTRGFRNLRLSIMDDSLRQLESHVNGDVATLGLDGWDVEFVVERKTKVGTLSHGMQTMIAPPGTTMLSKFESYCGGEVQRLRIATTIGMMKLISDYRGVLIDTEFYDEPTAHLGVQGVNDLLEFLRSRARIEGKRIFIVDHRSLDSGLFDGCMTVTKDTNGSSLGQWN